MQDKGQKETGLVSCRAFLFLSPTELCLSKGFTPKEAKSSSDPLIPPPSTSSPECELHGSQPPHPPRITGLFYQPPCLTDYFPRIESRKGYKPRRPKVQRAAPSASGVLFQAEVKLIRGLASSPFLLAPTSCLAPHSFQWSLSSLLSRPPGCPPPRSTSLRLSGIPCRPFEEGPSVWWGAPRRLLRNSDSVAISGPHCRAKQL